MSHPFDTTIAVHDGVVVATVGLTEEGVRHVWAELVTNAASWPPDRATVIDVLRRVEFHLSADEACDMADALSTVIGADAVDIDASIEADRVAAGWRDD